MQYKKQGGHSRLRYFLQSIVGSGHPESPLDSPDVHEHSQLGIYEGSDTMTILLKKKKRASYSENQNMLQISLNYLHFITVFAFLI